jgi:hypothetical protein
MADCYSKIGCPLISLRYLMLTLIEDAIRDSGNISPDQTGSYFRLVWDGGLSDAELKRYAKAAYAYHRMHTKEALYPERVLQELDQKWLTKTPSPSEVGIYVANERYIRHLMSGMGDKSGRMGPIRKRAPFLRI